MTVYLTSNSDYSAAYEGSVNASSEYFGACSYQTDQVKNAWAAVGVGEAATPCLQATIIGPGAMFCQEYGNFSANVYGGSGNYSYTWYVDYCLYSTDSYINVAFNPQYGDEYHYITLEVTDGNVSDSDSKDVYVYYCGMGNKINTTESINFTIYPNPATLETTIKIEDQTLITEPYDIQIIDRNGKLVYADKSYDKEIKINTSKLQKGIYNTIIKSNKKFGSMKLVIE